VLHRFVYMIKKHIKKILILALLAFPIIVIVGIYFFVKNQQAVYEINNKEILLVKNGETETEVGCTRTTRLDNEPIYDRALSLITEKYAIWEKTGSDYPLNYFPSQLTNCVKIIETNIKSSTNAEGYFIFHDSDIRNNYFPIYVDIAYAESDDVITGLLLVHEITHVRQYLDSVNSKKELSCIDKEAEAFHAIFEYERFQFGEYRKSLDLRLQHDKNLHPQLETIKAISEAIAPGGIVVPIHETCEGYSRDDTSYCIFKNHRDIIKTVLIDNELYKEQCNL